MFPSRKQIRLEQFDYSSKDCPYFLTICCYNKHEVFANSEIATLVLDDLMKRSELGKAVIYCFTIMPDHIHLVVSLKDGSLQSWVSAFKGYSAKLIKKSHGIEHVWQMGFYERVVRERESCVDVIRYVLDNPVRKGYAAIWEDYPYSKLLVDLY